MRDLTQIEIEFVSGSGPVDWLLGKLADYFVDAGTEKPMSNDRLGNFDPRNMDMKSLRPASGGGGGGASTTYTSREPNSWYVDLGSNGTIDAHVVRDPFDNFWVDTGKGYVNRGTGPGGGGLPREDNILQ